VPEIYWDGFRVWTEYGADAWTHVMQAGFAQCQIIALEYPAAQALVGVRRGTGRAGNAGEGSPPAAGMRDNCANSASV
jgi:hypothetical protein